ncbi:MAG: hypothetical protein ACI9EF_000156 [Pseudohongiellaceae bacterium]|jgi:hypothetical protein
MTGPWVRALATSCACLLIGPLTAAQALLPDDPPDVSPGVSFRPVELPTIGFGEWLYEAVLADLDGDGDLDIVRKLRRPGALSSGPGCTSSDDEAHYEYGLWVSLNDGAGEFAQAIPLNLVDTAGAAIEHTSEGLRLLSADVDADGDDDLIVQFESDRPRLFLSAATTTLQEQPLDFADDDTLHLAQVSWVERRAPLPPEMVVVLSSFSEPQAERHRFWGCRDGHFANHEVAPLPKGWWPDVSCSQDLGSDCAVQWIDYDLDGDLDVTLTPWLIETPLRLSLIVDGPVVGLHDASAELLPDFWPVGEGGSLAWGLLDNDELPDMVLGNYGMQGDGATEIFLRQRRGGQLVSAGNGLRGKATSDSTTVCCACVDLDGDGDDDVIALGHVNSQSYVAINRGNMTFDRVPLGLALGWPCGTILEIGDLDGDGDPDLFTANRGAGLILFNESR